LEEEVPEESYLIPFGKADIKKEGKDATIVATGQMVGRAISAANILFSEGIDVEVIDPRSLLPLDEATILESVQKTHRLLIVHEEVKFAGSGAEIAALVAEKAFKDLEAPILRIGGPFCPIPFSSNLEMEFIPSEEKIINGIKQLLKG
jgi:pyruvate dehydrogenase E1 component beta subunit